MFMIYFHIHFYETPSVPLKVSCHIIFSPWQVSRFYHVVAALWCFRLVRLWNIIMSNYFCLYVMQVFFCSWLEWLSTSTVTTSCAAWGNLERLSTGSQMVPQSWSTPDLDSHQILIHIRSWSTPCPDPHHVLINTMSWFTPDPDPHHVLIHTRSWFTPCPDSH